MVPGASASSGELVLIGGKIAVGKTALANALATLGGARPVSVRRALQEILGGTDWDRHRLQVDGAALDKRTNGRWLLEYLLSLAEPGARLVVDAARTQRQVEAIFESVGDARLIFLAASESTRRRRFSEASVADVVKRSTSFDEAMAHATEKEAGTIRSMASVVIETDDLSPEQVAREAFAFLGW